MAWSWCPPSPLYCWRSRAMPSTSVSWAQLWSVLIEASIRALQGRLGRRGSAARCGQGKTRRRTPTSRTLTRPRGAARCAAAASAGSRSRSVSKRFTPSRQMKRVQESKCVLSSGGPPGAWASWTSSSTIVPAGASMVKHGQPTTCSSNSKVSTAPRVPSSSTSHWPGAVSTALGRRTDAEGRRAPGTRSTPRAAGASRARATR